MGVESRSYNIIDAIINLVKNPILTVDRSSNKKNRANSSGDAFEAYVKDLFAGTFNCNKRGRNNKQNKVFSYLGGDANPPDAMLRGGDAIEIKKIETNTAELALNSSYPHHKLYASSSKINNKCKNAEAWECKDILYMVGCVKNKELKYLCAVYGEDFCASRKVYEDLESAIKNGITSKENFDWVDTKELGRLNQVDPLGISYLRIRPMWGIKNPWITFDYICKRDDTKKFNFMAVINDNKWKTFENTKDLVELSNQNPDLIIKDVKIKNPDDPEEERDAKLVTYTISPESDEVRDGAPIADAKKFD